ncbi:MAG: hypothetical protein ACQEXJ_13275 [Myxococcota bacterium]
MSWECPWTVLLVDDQCAVPLSYRAEAGSSDDDPVQKALSRAGLVSGPDRILLSMPQACLTRTRTGGLDPDTCLSVHPREVGTGPAVLLSLLMIERSSPDPIVALIPAHREISDDLRFMGYVRQAVTWVESNPDDVVDIVVRPRAADPCCRWVVNRPSDDTPLVPMPARVLAARSDEEADELFRGGAWWDTGVTVATVKTLLGLFESSQEGFVRDTRAALRDGWDAVAEHFDNWSPFDFHLDVLASAGTALRALRARSVHVDPRAAADAHASSVRHAPLSAEPGRGAVAYEYGPEA